MSDEPNYSVLDMVLLKTMFFSTQSGISGLYSFKQDIEELRRSIEQQRLSRKDSSHQAVPVIERIVARMNDTLTTFPVNENTSSPEELRYYSSLQVFRDDILMLLNAIRFEVKTVGFSQQL